jgi:uncharacterized protein
MIPFYNAGLRFECTKCSYCCRYTPGFVFLSHNDLGRLVTAFHMEQDEFIATYCRFVDMSDRVKLSFIEKDNYDCEFWEKNGCSIYEHRPLQCKSYPFWGSNLQSPKEWAELGFFCPGVGKGTCHSQGSIEEWIHIIEKENYDFARIREDFEQQHESNS